MENSKITISNPCNKKWNNMLPYENGKFCDACNKNVIDFTDWETENIKNYLQSQPNTVCGRLNTFQVVVKRPKHHQYLVNQYLKIERNFKSSIYKTLSLSILVLCMMIVGCNTPTTGEIEIKEKTNTSCHPKSQVTMGVLLSPAPVTTKTGAIKHLNSKK